MTLRLLVGAQPQPPTKLTLNIVDKLPDGGRVQTSETALAFFAPRGLGDDAWSGDAKKQTQIRRRFMLLGQTLDSMRVWDIRQAIRALRAKHPSAELRVEGAGAQGVNLLYASLFEPGISGLTLSDLPTSHQQGPDYLNVLRVMDIPVALKIAESRLPIQVRGAAGK